jgi:uncharacterized membrane protein
VDQGDAHDPHDSATPLAIKQPCQEAEQEAKKGSGEKSFAYKRIFRLDCAAPPGSNCAPVSMKD